MDLQIGRIAKAVEAAGGIMILSADHGNADDMFEHAKDGSVRRKDNGDPQAKTSHSLSGAVHHAITATTEVLKTLNEGLGISSLAATMMNLLDFEAPADDKSIITMRATVCAFGIEPLVCRRKRCSILIARSRMGHLVSLQRTGHGDRLLQQNYSFVRYRTPLSGHGSLLLG